jgi:hypothetical protein
MAILSSYEEYLTLECVPSGGEYEVDPERVERLARFPYSVVLQVAYPEMDFANRWCWGHLGPSYGECRQKDSNCCVCLIESPHCHFGVWTDRWLEKTDYNYGFNEWFFQSVADQNAFLEFVPMISWGEKFPD